MKEEKKQETPKQFKNIDKIDLREAINNKMK